MRVARIVQGALHERAGRRSLRFKITMGVLLIGSCILWGAIGVFWLYQGSAIREMHENRWNSSAERLVRRFTETVPGADALTLDVLAIDVLSPFYDRYTFEIFRADGTPAVAGRTPRVSAENAGVAQAASAPPGEPLIRSARIPLSRDAGHPPERVRVYTSPFKGTDGNPYVLAFAVSEAALDERLALFRQTLLLVGGVGSLASALSGWYVAGLAVAPLERLRRYAADFGGDAPRPGGLQAEIAGSSREVARLAQELEDARRRVAERFVAQERFLSNVSHELKTPISVLLTEVQTLDVDSLPEAVRRFAESVEEEMGRLGRLVESFLTLSRIRDGRGLTRFRPYTVNDLVMDSVENCRKMAEQHHVRLEPELLTSERGLEAAVSGEPELLRTMVDNLVRNAIRFSPSAGVVRVRADLPAGDADRVHIAVSDRGPGIPIDRLRTIFDRFAQAPHQRQGRGHGLGLTIALGIAELHGGTISAENVPSGGCRFTAMLPLRDIGAPTPSDSSSAAL